MTQLLFTLLWSILRFLLSYKKSHTEIQTFILLLKIRISSTKTWDFENTFVHHIIRIKISHVTFKKIWILFLLIIYKPIQILDDVDYLHCRYIYDMWRIKMIINEMMIIAHRDLSLPYENRQCQTRKLILVVNAMECLGTYDER